jgi:outer membrane protein
VKPEPIRLAAAAVLFAAGTVSAQPAAEKSVSTRVAEKPASTRVAEKPASTRVAEKSASPPRPGDSGTIALSIDDAFGAAVPASEAIAAAKADVERAEAQVTAARSGYLPQLNASSQYQRTLRSEFEDISFGMPGMEEVDLPFGQRNTWRVGLTVAQPIFDGFRTKSAVQQARAGVRSSEIGVKETKAQLILSVAAAYYDAVLAQRQVEIAEVTLQQAEQTLAETQLGFKEGATPEFDQVRAQVARDNQATALVQFRTQRDVALVQLRRLVGAPLDQPLALSSGLDTDDVDAVVASATNAAGLGTEGARAAIAQAKEIVAARAAGVGVAKSERWPQLVASSDFGLVDYAGHPFNSDWRTNWTVAVTLSVPLFDGFRRRAAIRAANAELATSKAQLADVTERAGVEDAQAGANVAAAVTTLETTTRTVGQAQRAYEIAELRFQQGASTHLELVDARVQLEQSLLNQARAARDLRVARVRQALLPGLPLGAGAGGF